MFQPFVVEMELSLLLLEALDEWGVSPLLVLARVRVRVRVS